MPSASKEHISPIALGIVCLITLALAAFLRLNDLDRYPLHADEAVQGIKLEEFLDKGTFDYDPTEFHGPLPHYLAKAALSANGRLSDWESIPLDESDLRLAPALAGIVVVLLVGWLAVVAWGTAGALPAMLLAAVSPSLVYYSRDYIAEMFFVAGTCLFLMGTARFFGDRGKRDRDILWLWAAGSGVGAGLMHAAKETCVLSFAAAAIAALIVYGFGKAQRKFLWVGLVTAVLTSVAIYSDGFRNWSDVAESLATYLRYLNRAEGEGHQHPWWFYAQRYSWFRGGYLWTEIGVFLLGLIGFIASWVRGVKIGRFLGLYAILLFAIYCVIPYKTPWSILPALIAWFPLAGGLLTIHKGAAQRAIWLIVLLGVVLHLFVQANRATGRMATDPRNPYSYAHTSTQLSQLLDLITEIDTIAPGPIDLVIADPWMAWPLPWYFRNRANVRYRTDFPTEPTASLTIAAATVLPEKTHPSWEALHPKLYGLRADLPLVAYIDKTLWTELLKRKEKARE